MKLIIAGSRHFDISSENIESIRQIFWKSIPCNWLEVVSGGCPTGTDSAAKDFAEIHGNDYKEFSADWEKYGKAAGPIRNKQMAEYGDALLLIWDGESKGSKNMKQEMEKLKKPVYEVILKGLKNG